MQRCFSIAVSLLLVLLASQYALALDNGIGVVPPMGYSTAFDVGCTEAMNETTIRATAEAIVSLGLDKFGYQYILLDDCWSSGRDANGQLEPDAGFASGIDQLAEYLRSLGLSIGIYTDRGTETCEGRPGSEGYEALDAKTFAAWGIDYVTSASCYADNSTAATQYGLMRDALNATGRPIFFSLYGQAPWYAEIGPALGNSWRVDVDEPTWDGVLNSIDTMAVNALAPYAGVGAFNQPMPLLSLNYQADAYLNENQTRTQVGQYAILASPMIISGSVLQMSDYTLETYTNVEVIAVNQDPLVQQGVLIWSSPEKTLANGAQQIWARPLVDGSFAVHFINAGEAEMDIQCDSDCFGAMKGFPNGYGVTIRDLWSHRDIQMVESASFTVPSLPGNWGSALYKFSWVPMSPDALPLYDTPGDPHSAIQLDPTLMPRNHSSIPGYEKYVEQCGEFVYRYFHTLGLNYPTMGQPYYFLMTGLDEKNQSHPAYQRILNNGYVPPKAGDILVAKGPASGEFHTALIQAVQGGIVHVFQANVAWDYQAPGKFLYAKLPLQYNLTTNRYYMPDLPTSTLGYNHDFQVKGWIHPTGAANSLPGSPP